MREYIIVFRNPMYRGRATYLALAQVLNGAGVYRRVLIESYHGDLRFRYVSALNGMDYNDILQYPSAVPVGKPRRTARALYEKATATPEPEVDEAYETILQIRQFVDKVCEYRGPQREDVLRFLVGAAVGTMAREMPFVKITDTITEGFEESFADEEEVRNFLFSARKSRKELNAVAYALIGHMVATTDFSDDDE